MSYEIIRLKHFLMGFLKEKSISSCFLCTREICPISKSVSSRRNMHDLREHTSLSSHPASTWTLIAKIVEVITTVWIDHFFFFFKEKKSMKMDSLLTQMLSIHFLKDTLILIAFLLEKIIGIQFLPFPFSQVVLFAKVKAQGLECKSWKTEKLWRAHRWICTITESPRLDRTSKIIQSNSALSAPTFEPRVSSVCPFHAVALFRQCYLHLFVSPHLTNCWGHTYVLCFVRLFWRP